jgi:starch synthase
VATATGGIPEVVVDGSTGILVAVDDHVAMTEAIDGLLSDRSRATAMGIAARRRAEAELSFGRFIDGYARLFRQLVPDGGAHPA